MHAATLTRPLTHTATPVTFAEAAERHLHLRLALDGRQLDLCSERCLWDRYRHRYIDVVALSREERVLTDVGQNKQIAGFGPEPSAMAFFRHADA